MSSRIQGLGWVPQLPDHRDLCALDHIAVDPTANLPKYIDERGLWQPIVDQGQLGSCTANAVCAVLQFNEKEETHWAKRPQDSRLFHYYNTRILQGTVNQDSGASIRNAIKAAVQWGYIPEAMCPYNIKNFKQKPTQAMYTAAMPHKVSLYASVPQDETSMKQMLAAGHPVVVGFSVYASFEKVGKDGMIPMPTKDEAMVGGHAVVIVGYDEKGWIFRNSWGQDFGEGGYGHFPYEYLLDSGLASDFWVIKAVPQPA